MAPSPTVSHLSAGWSSSSYHVNAALAERYIMVGQPDRQLGGIEHGLIIIPARGQLF